MHNISEKTASNQDSDNTVDATRRASLWISLTAIDIGVILILDCLNIADHPTLVSLFHLLMPTGMLVTWISMKSVVPTASFKGAPFSSRYLFACGLLLALGGIAIRILFHDTKTTSIIAGSVALTALLIYLNLSAREVKAAKPA